MPQGGFEVQAYRRNKLGIDLKIDDYNDPECYKIELSKDEYIQLIQKIDSLKHENYIQKLAYEKNLNDQQRQADAKLAETNDRLSAVIEDLEDRIANDTEYKRLVMQQKNASCADRGVSKKLSGYFFIDAVEWREKTSKSGKKIITWKYVIQTPFLSVYPRYTIENAVLDMLSKKILPECGCHCFVDEDKKADFGRFITSYGELIDKYSKEPCVYDWKIRANFAKGYWEIELFITGELEIPAKYNLHYCQKNRADELRKV